MRHRQQGFTLIEMMIVVAIIAVLTAIAVPAYSSYVKRSRITDAVSALSGMRVKMEQYFQDNRTYTGAGTAASAGVTVANCPAASTNFTFACTPSGDGTGYTLTATGINTMVGFLYSVDEKNNRSSSGPSGWSSPNPNNCWLLNKDGSC